MEQKHTVSLFWTFFLGYLVVGFIHLFLPGVILLIAGIWVRPCLYIGLCLLVLDLIFSLRLAIPKHRVIVYTEQTEDATDDISAQTDEIFSTGAFLCAGLYKVRCGAI